MKKGICFTLLAASVLSLSAQSGYSSGSYSISQAQSQQVHTTGTPILPQPQTVIVEEYMNYHRHSLPMPEKNENVHMDVSWGKVLGTETKDMILQIGFTTQRAQHSDDNLPPVNIGIVVDKSGSMDGMKMQKTLEALDIFVQKLRPQDYVSIVEFDDRAVVRLAATKAENISHIRQVIRSIYVGGSTNLEEGIKTGYLEVIKHAGPAQASRLIVLTDAITNTGIINPEEIVKNTNVYREAHNVDFVMVGVGLDFHQALGRSLTNSGRCQMHYIHDVQNIRKVFDEEAESLLYPVAKAPKLSVDFLNGWECVQTYGYVPQVTENGVKYELKDMNAGLTQVFLFRLRPKNPQKAAVNIQFSYLDIGRGKTVTQEITAAPAKIETAFKEVNKNYAIAHMAVALREMAQLYQDKKPQQAQVTIANALKAVESEEVLMRDPDVMRMAAILKNYVKDLEQYVKVAPELRPQRANVWEE